MRFHKVPCTLKALKASVASRVPEPLKKVKIYEQVAGGGRTPNIKSADYICIRRNSNGSFRQT
jgi:hypothetical protein